MSRATITIKSTDVHLTRSGDSTIIDYPEDKIGTTMFGKLEQTSAGATHTYMSEIAQVLLYGAPQYKVNEQGQMIYVPTGEVVPETTPTLQKRYKDGAALLNDAAAQNWTRKIIVDGTPLDWTQYGGLPAAFYGSDAVTGELVQLEAPAQPVTTSLPTPSTIAADLSPFVFQVKPDGRVILDGIAGVPYVAQFSAKGLKDGYGHFSLDAVPGPGSTQVGRTREIHGDGKIIEARGLPSVSSDVTYQVKNERFVTVNDAPQDVGTLEVSWIGDQSAAFFVESHPPK